MKTHIYGTEGNPSLMLLPGLGVSYEMFLPLISLLKDRFHIVAVEVDGFILGEYSRFTRACSPGCRTAAAVAARIGGLMENSANID